MLGRSAVNVKNDKRRVGPNMDGDFLWRVPVRAVPDGSDIVQMAPTAPGTSTGQGQGVVNMNEDKCE